MSSNEIKPKHLEALSTFISRKNTFVALPTLKTKLKTIPEAEASVAKEHSPHLSILNLNCTNQEAHKIT